MADLRPYPSLEYNARYEKAVGKFRQKFPNAPVPNSPAAASAPVPVEQVLLYAFICSNNLSDYSQTTSAPVQPKLSPEEENALADELKGKGMHLSCRSCCTPDWCWLYFHR